MEDFVSGALMVTGTRGRKSLPIARPLNQPAPSRGAAQSTNGDIPQMPPASGYGSISASIAKPGDQNPVTSVLTVTGRIRRLERV